MGPCRAGNSTDPSGQVFGISAAAAGLRGLAKAPPHRGHLGYKSVPHDYGSPLPGANVWRWRWYVGVQAGSTDSRLDFVSIPRQRSEIAEAE